MKNEFLKLKIYRKLALFWSLAAGSFFLPGLIWGRTVFCIDIANSTRIHMVKLHLPHMYMIFVDNSKEK